MKGKLSKRTLILLCIASMLVATIGVAFQTKAEKPLETLDPTLQQITFSNYGWKNETYSGMGDISVKYGYGESLAGKVISANVTFSSDAAYMYIGGGSLGIWKGLYLKSGQTDGSLVLGVAGTKYTFTPAIADVKLVDNPFNLKLSYQVIDSDSNGTSDALQLGVWFNDKLYNNEFITVSTYGENRTYKDYLTGGLGVYAPGKASLKIASDVPKIEVLDSNLEQITLSNYGWDDRSFSNMPDISVKYGYKETLDGKVISGKVTLSGDNARIYVGGGDQGIWKGLNFKSESDGSLKFKLAGKEYTLTSAVAGVTLVDNPFNLKLSYQTFDSDKDGAKDSLKLGVWFNNKLYNNKYFVVSKYGDNRTYKDYLTGGLGFYTIGSSSLKIVSDVVQTLDPSLEKIAFSDYGWKNGVYSDMADISVKYGYEGSLKNKVISGTVTFSANDARVYIGGGERGIWSGLSLQSSSDGNLKLKLAGEEQILTSATAGVTLIDNPLNLKLSYQVVDADEDGTEDTLRLGVWFSDKLYNNEYFEVTTYGENRTYKDYLTGGFGIYAPKVIGGTGSLTIASDVPEVLDPLLEEITFSNYGWDDGTYSNMTDISTKYGYGETLDGKVISGDITFSANDARIYVGGGELGIWKGLSLKSGQSDGSLKLGFAGEEYTLTSAVAGVTLVNNPFNLKLSYQVLDTDADETKDTLRLGVWFNNKLYNNNYFEVSTYGENRTYKDYLTGGFGIYAPKFAEGTGSLTITSEKPEVMDPTLEHITFSDFGWPDGTYSNMTDITVKYEYAGSFAEKVISGDVSFSANDAWIYIGGGSKGIWSGLSLASGQEDGNLKFGFGGKSYMIHPAKAGTTLVDNTFNLKISYQVIDKDKDGMKDTLKLGLWFNDTLYNNEYFYVSTYGESGTYEDYLKGGMGIFAPQGLNGSGVVTISSEVVNVEFPEVLDPNLEQITFRDFGIENGRYTYTGDFSATGTYNGTLDGKVFSGDVTFSTKPVHLFIGGKPDAWYGISLATGQPDVSSQNLRLIIGRQKHILKPSIAGVTLVGETYNLKLSYQVIDQNNDGKKDTLQFGVWFNDKLYNNEYFYVSTYESSYKDYGTRTYEDYLEGRIALYAQVKGAALKIASDGAEVMNSNLQQITFSDFGIKDDTYSYVGDLAASGTYSGTLAGKVICGDVTFSSKPATLFVGGEPDVTYGMSITSETNGNLVLNLGDNEYVLTPNVAGTKLVEKELNLKLSYQVVDDDNDGKDDTLQLGVWFNNKLYNNEYFYVSTYENDYTGYGTRTYADYLTGRLALHPKTQGAYIKLVSTKPEVLDASLEKITFVDFNISNATYSKEGGFKIGFYSAGSLDGKVFSGDVTFSNLRSDIWIGGQESAWGGIGLISGYQDDTTTLRLLAKGRQYVFTPEIAGTTLVGEKFNLKLSYQLVDLNNDKAKDTLKLGVWFNNRLYNNQYIYIENYKDCIGGYMGIYTEKAGSYVTVASDLKIDNPALGSRRAPSPNTGDTENIVLYICVAVLAMVAIVALRKRQRLE